MTTEGNGIEDAMAAFQAEVSVEEESSDSSPEEIQTDEVAEEDAESEEVEVSDTDDEEEEVDEIDDEPELPSVEYVKADGKRVKIDYSDRGPRTLLNLHPYDCRARVIRTRQWKYVLHERFRPQLYNLTYTQIVINYTY